MSVIKNFRQQDRELASGYIVTRCSKTSCILNPNVRQLGIISPLSYPNHPDGQQVQDEQEAGPDWVTVRANQWSQRHQHPRAEWAFWEDMCHEETGDSFNRRFSQQSLIKSRWRLLQRTIPQIEVTHALFDFKTSKQKKPQFIQNEIMFC